MIKAVNMKGYKFGRGFQYSFKGFGILDEETNQFYSLDGKIPYVLATKKVIQGVIDSGWTSTMQTVSAN